MEVVSCGIPGEGRTDRFLAITWGDWLRLSVGRKVTGCCRFATRYGQDLPVYLKCHYCSCGITGFVSVADWNSLHLSYGWTVRCFDGLEMCGSALI
ncbi:hypothetical protein L484_028101 [Morus notabilis]|uniref:Uncharacterized protein n=1 Tax=Morus notabilis TaxID=981085 RepID=W9SIG8_9ROSA|nr:hypothetical protein L484_028101 [Morus notabilis]